MSCTMWFYLAVAFSALYFITSVVLVVVLGRYERLRQTRIMIVGGKPYLFTPISATSGNLSHEGRPIAEPKTPR